MRAGAAAVPTHSAAFQVQVAWEQPRSQEDRDLCVRIGGKESCAAGGQEAGEERHERVETERRARLETGDGRL